MIRSKKIKESARGEDCSLRLGNCSSNETTVFCHLNSNFRGVGLKSPDIFGVYGCYSCHVALDSNQVSHEDQLRALIETQMKLFNKGLINVI